MQRGHLNTTGNTEQTEQETPLNHCHVSPAPTNSTWLMLMLMHGTRMLLAGLWVSVGGNSVAWCEAENRSVWSSTAPPTVNLSVRAMCDMVQQQQ